MRGTYYDTQCPIRALRYPEQPEDEDEDDEAGPAGNLLPHAGLLLHDGVTDNHPGEYQQTWVTVQQEASMLRSLRCKSSDQVYYIEAIVDSFLN